MEMNKDFFSFFDRLYIGKKHGNVPHECRINLSKLRKLNYSILLHFHLDGHKNSDIVFGDDNAIKLALKIQLSLFIIKFFCITK